MIVLSVRHITKSFGGQPVLRDVTLDVADHRTISILGRSGSGKTTMLKIIAGLTAPDDGTIWMNKHEIGQLSPRDRHIVYIYQESLLFPHLNVYENVAFGLRVRRLPEDEIHDLTQSMLKNLGLEAKAESMPDELSGGQQQRVSFGRALIINPGILLLDEPFGNLDSRTRQEMQSFFKSIAEQYAITSLFVTHDLKEAILMGDQIGLLKEGKVRIYETRDEFVKDSESGVREEQEFWQSLSGNR